MSETGPFLARKKKLAVTGLGEADEEFRLDDHYGLICDVRNGGESGQAPLAELEAAEPERNERLLADYRYWLWNWR